MVIRKSIVKLYSTSDDVDDDPLTEDSVAKTYALGDSFNVTAEMSETVLAGSSILFGTGTSVVLTAAQMVH